MLRRFGRRRDAGCSRRGGRPGCASRRRRTRNASASGRRNPCAMASASERWASGAWLTPPLMRFAAVAMIVGTVASLAFLLATAHGTLDRLDRPLGTDFSSFWSAGRMALEGRAALSYD